MLNFLLNIPFELRLVGLFFAGAVLAAVVHLLVDRLRLETPRVSPWNGLLDRPHKPGVSQRRASSRRAKPKRRRDKTPPTRWWPRVPILGWLARRDEEAALGQGFWVRPLLVELGFGLALALLYWWEVGQWRMVPELMPRFNPPPANPPLVAAETLHLQYASHVILLVFMLAASLIDVDEWVIPDSIAVTGTLLGLALAVVAPAAFLSGGPVPVALTAMHLGSPGPWPEALNAGQLAGLAIALGCWWMWCFALLPRTWRMSRGLGVAVRLFWLRLVRDRWTWWVLLLGAAGMAGITAMWWLAGGARWNALLTALVGMAVGGGIIWVVRIVCSSVLRKEAMGFGDVTLMAMIGAFLGWQAALMVFFLSPFFGLVPPILALFRRDKVPPAIPYGPFLCLAAVTVLLLWAPLWSWAADLAPVFAVLFAGWFGVGLFAGAIGLMIVLLMLLQAIKRAMGVG